MDMGIDAWLDIAQPSNAFQAEELKYESLCKECESLRSCADGQATVGLTTEASRSRVTRSGATADLEISQLGCIMNFHILPV